MLKLRSCPKCKNGYVTLDRDYYGWYEYCIHCGYTHDLKSILEVGQQAWDGRGGKIRLGALGKDKLASDGL